MTWFGIDPAARAIIKCLETQPERWHDGEYRLFLDGQDEYGSLVNLWKNGELSLLRNYLRTQSQGGS